MRQVTQTIHTHSLGNGLVLVAEPIPSLESAAFSFLIPAGCCSDPPDRHGLTAFTCEMALRGAGPRDNRAFVEALENLGVERHESVSVEHTVLAGASLASHLPDALTLYSDLLRAPHLPPVELEAGRMVVLQELRAIEDEPSQKVMMELRRRQFPDPWGRSSQGERDALEAITIDEIREQYRKLYRPNGTILGVAGRFDWPQLKDHVERVLGDWKTVAFQRPQESKAPQKHAHVAFESNQTQIGIAYESIPYRHPDYFRAWGSVGVLSGGMSSRLFTEVRERRGLCYSVYASLQTQRERAGVFCYAGTSERRAQETLDVTIAELSRLAEGIEAAELDRLKARIKSGLIMQQESSSARSSAVARDWYHLGHVRTLDELGRLVDELSCDSINSFLSEHPPRDFAVVTLGSSPLQVPA